MKYGIPAATAALALLIGAGVSSTAMAATAIVKMKYDEISGALYFEPAKLTIDPGDTVVWLQDDADNEHNAAAYPGLIPDGTQPFESQMMARVGESWSMTFDKEGSYFYHCHPHEAAGMKGLVVVGRESMPEEFRNPGDGEMSHDHGGMEGMSHGDSDDSGGMEHGDAGDTGNGDDNHGDGHHGDKKEQTKETKKKKRDHHGDHG